MKKTIKLRNGATATVHEIIALHGKIEYYVTSIGHIQPDEVAGITMEMSQEEHGTLVEFTREVGSITAPRDLVVNSIMSKKTENIHTYIMAIHAVHNSDRIDNMMRDPRTRKIMLNAFMDVLDAMDSHIASLYKATLNLISL